MKGVEIVLAGFGTWPHFFQHGPKWKSRGQVPKPFGGQFDPFQNERGRNGSSRVWNLTPLFPTWTKMEK
jgi:hypothetical protein